MKPPTLAPHHYAAGWKYEDCAMRPTAEITELGRIYAELPDEIDGRSNPAKQAKLLELCQEFHPYLIKYMVMICRGHVPVWGAGQAKNSVNKDIKRFIQFFLPKGAPLNRPNMGKAVRHLHLAFKRMESEEIYDVLMEQFLKAVKKYDPRYTEKVRIVGEKIEEVFSDVSSFTVADLNDYLEFDCNRYLRMLCLRGFLAPVYGQGKENKITGFKRTASWPPPDHFFESGAIGFAYYLQTWFRYYLQAAVTVN